MTKIDSVLDVLERLNYRKRIEFDTIQTSVYRLDDLRDGGILNVLVRDPTVKFSSEITIDQGMFFSLNTKHCYFSPRYQGGDWICLAIKLRRHL
jgi:hypothetical protein